MAMPEPSSAEDHDHDQYHSSATPSSSAEFLRLRWEIAENLATSVHVIDDLLSDSNDYNDSNNNDSSSNGSSTEGHQIGLQPYITVGEDGNVRRHHISSAPITHPPVSHLVVSVDDLDGLAYDWQGAIESADEEGDESACWESYPSHHHQSLTNSVDTNDKNHEDDSETDNVHNNNNNHDSRGDRFIGSLRFSGCLKQPDLLAPAPVLHVRPTTRAYITIGDYIDAVHPWLLSWKREIVEAKCLRSRKPWQGRLFVSPVSVTPLMIGDAEDLLVIRQWSLELFGHSQSHGTNAAAAAAAAAAAETLSSGPLDSRICKAFTDALTLDVEQLPRNGC